MLSDEQILKFQMLYKKHYGEETSREEVLDKGMKLVQLIRLICEPLSRTEYAKLQELHKEIGHL